MQRCVAEVLRTDTGPAVMANRRNLTAERLPSTDRTDTDEWATAPTVVPEIDPRAPGICALPNATEGEPASASIRGGTRTSYRVRARGAEIGAGAKSFGASPARTREAPKGEKPYSTRSLSSTSAGCTAISMSRGGVECR